MAGQIEQDAELSDFMGKARDHLVFLFLQRKLYERTNYINLLNRSGIITREEVNFSFFALTNSRGSLYRKTRNSTIDSEAYHRSIPYILYRLSRK